MSDKPQLLNVLPAEVYGAAGAGFVGLVAWLAAKLYKTALEDQLHELKSEVYKIQEHIMELRQNATERRAIATEQQRVLDRILDKLEKI
jgi:hypothetical protein